MEGKYKAQAKCENCGWSGKLEVKKGILVEEELCPECGCMTLLPRMKRPSIV